jgi:outer membrane receptor protein involved in Fe transport
MLRSVVLVTLLALNLSSPVSSAATLSSGDDLPSITGRVIDAATGRPLPGATVRLSGTTIAVRSDADGRFALSPLASGEHLVAVRLDGYRPAETRVVVNSSRLPPPLDVTLVPDALRLAESVSVTATRDEREAFEVPRSVAIVAEAELRRTAPRTSAEALARAPGVFVQKTNHGGGSPFVRGLVGNQVLVLVDGIRLNNSTFRYGPNQYLATVDSGTASRLEVLRGSGSVQYGSDALGGVVHVRNRNPLLSAGGVLPTLGVSGRLMTQGMEQSLRLDLGVAGSRAAVAGNVALRNFGDIVAGGGLGVESPSGYTETNVDARGVVKVGRSSTMTFAYDHVYQDDVPRWDQVAQRGYSRYAFDPQVRQFAFARFDQVRAGEKIDNLSVTAAWVRSRERRERRRNSSSLLTTEQDTVNTLALTTQARAVPLAGMTVVAGGEFYSDWVDSWRIDTNTGSGVATSLRGLFPTDAGAKSLAGFGLASYRRGRFGAEAGTRYTWTRVTAKDPVFGDVDVSPGAWVGSASASFLAIDRVSVYANVSQGFRAPNLDDLSTLGLFDFGVEVPAGELQPERSLSLEAGAKLRGRRFAAALAIFRTNLSDLIERRLVAAPPVMLPFPGEDRYYQRVNIGKGYVRGVEGEWEWSLSQAMTLFSHVSYTFGQNVTLGEPMRRIPPLNGLLGLRYEGESGWWARGSLQAAATQDRLAAGDRDDHRIPPGGTPGWQVVDAFAGMPLSRRFTVSLGALNLFNEAYRTHGSGIDGYGRSAWLGVDARF